MTVAYRREGDVALIVYQRVERRNAWDLATYRAAADAVRRANDDAAVGTIVIAADGPSFCAGADLRASPEPRDSETGRRPDMATEAMAAGTGWVQLLAGSKPVIAAVQGVAIGLGITHVLAADIRIAAAGARFAFPFLERGTMPEFGATALLARLVGHGRARDLCLSASTIEATEALRIGLVTRVVPEEMLRDAAMALAARIAGFDREATRHAKTLLVANEAEPDIEAVLARERAAFVTMRRARFRH
ncbi:enoyl-CoA hydratase/isomerase family protein [Sphingomonas bacterium]|uniref:enoyl-CoA hydratase/isomerase family protein n=1 Tax=Sphingomonas bacterium TaxID=1895847 RepID=UPI001575C2FF|nr:enoyl-CoA hydratase/isomerase family protein [Sphingomonas bacterium]